MTGRKFMLQLKIISMLLIWGCSTDPSNSIPVTPPDKLNITRPAEVLVPSDYDSSVSYPVVIMLHGFGANAAAQDFIFGLKDRVDTFQFILVTPDGTKNAEGNRFWNATPQCCNFDDDPVDDVAYIDSLITEAQETMNIDPSRIGLVGHSNGGYMSYRFACEHPDKINRIAVLAGSVYLESGDCTANLPVNVLHMHGTADTVIHYNPFIPLDDDDTVETVGAVAAVERWRLRAGCGAEPDVRSSIDLLTSQEDAETDVSEWTTCSSGKSITFWSMNEGDHIFPDVNTTFKDGISRYLTQ